MTISISNRVQQLEASATIAAKQLADKLKKEGRDVVSFTVGQPDKSTPLAAREKLAQWVASDGFLAGYSAVPGLSFLREIAAKKVFGPTVTYDPSQVLVTPGAKMALNMAFGALINTGDEVLLPTPCWVSYSSIIKLYGGVPIEVSTADNDYRLTADMLRPYITDKTKALLFSSPSNPTGKMIDPSELKKIASLCVEKDIVVIADEIYNKITYGDVEPVSIASLGEEIYERTITINGMSKFAAMTGTRVGFMGVPTSLQPQLAKYAGQLFFHTSNMDQALAFFCLGGNMSYMTGESGDLMDPQLEAAVETDIKSMIAEFAEKKDLVVAGLRAIPNVVCHEPDGAFYVTVDVSAYTTDDMQFMQGLGEKEAVVLVPGTPFGYPGGNLRLSYATSKEQITEGVRRMAKYIEGLQS